MTKPIGLIAVETGWGGKFHTSSMGAAFLREKKIEQLLQIQGNYADWIACVKSPTPYGDITQLSYSQKVNEIKAVTLQLKVALNQAYSKYFPLVLGGDDSISIGTWSGMMSSMSEGELGLIWIDAHMDSHTPQTTPSFNIHGMPLAVLLGYGEPALVSILNKQYLNPKNLVLMATRSYESGEAALLQKLNVKIYFMDEIKKRGFQTIFEDARSYLAQNTQKIGISLDIDAFDPVFVPGTGSPEPNGLERQEVLNAFHGLAHQNQIAAFQIAEFDPTRDKDHITFKLILDLITSFFSKDGYGQ